MTSGSSRPAGREPKNCFWERRSQIADRLVKGWPVPALQPGVIRKRLSTFGRCRCQATIENQSWCRIHRLRKSQGQFSPDGRWVAYQSNESGSSFEIVVQAFPEPRGKWQVSTGGGVQPRWRADGKELYFIAPDRKLMAVPVAVLGSIFEAGKPVPLFATRISNVGNSMQAPVCSLAGWPLSDQPGPGRTHGRTHHAHSQLESGAEEITPGASLH